jgi:hypothetical protein
MPFTGQLPLWLLSESHFQLQFIPAKKRDWPGLFTLTITRGNNAVAFE